mgnify:CR=1 FL=1
MSLRINSNPAAVNAYRNLTSTNVGLGKSLEKLSSGFRINRAADEPRRAEPCHVGHAFTAFHSVHPAIRASRRPGYEKR